jgi:micrococcal nuclease
VRLFSNTSQLNYDEYQRLLAYLEVEGKDFGTMLLEAGLARVFERYPVSKTFMYRTLQSDTKASARGIWG